MTLIHTRNAFRTHLAPLYGQREIDDIFKRLIHHLFQWEGVMIALEPNYILSSSESEKINTSLRALQKAIPLQYLLGETQFFGLNFYVDQNVLIPRPETEELVEWVLEEKNDPLSLLDLGTGSGCIALSLKKHRPLWRISGVDVSDKALRVAQKNAKVQGLKVDFLKHDILSNTLKDFNKQDVIVSNPPYVLPSEQSKMHANVLDHEPDTALFVPEEDPLLFYKAILDLGKVILKPRGRIYFEINPLCWESLVELCEKSGYTHLAVKQDIFQKKRMLKMMLKT